MAIATSRTAALLDQRAAEVTRGVGNAHPMFIERASGATVWDVDGKQYIDFIGGIGVLNVGHTNPRVAAAIRDQLERFTHVVLSSRDVRFVRRTRASPEPFGARPEPQEDAFVEHRRGGHGERGQDRARVHRPPGGHRLSTRLSRAHVARAHHDGQERAVQTALRTVLQRDLSRAVSKRVRRLDRPARSGGARRCV